MSLWIFAGLTAAIAVLTFGSLISYEAWWIRGLDFPRLQLAVIAGLLAVLELVLLDLALVRSWLLIAVSCACLFYQAWWILPYTRLFPREVKRAGPVDPDNRIRIMGANVLTPNRNWEGLLDQVTARQPDILVAVETDQWWESKLDRLAPTYPHTLKCPLDNLYGMHVYSRFPLRDAEVQYLVEKDIPSMHVLVQLPSGRCVQIHFIHPAPPSPTENAESSERDAELIVVGKTAAEARYPVIVTGDLNDVAWSATARLFRKISGLLDPRVGRGMFNTFHAGYPFLRWPLDHLFHSDDFTLVRMERLRAFGSDHFPILVELALEPRRGEDQEGLEAEGEDREWAREKENAEGVDKEDVHRPGE